MTIIYAGRRAYQRKVPNLSFINYKSELIKFVLYENDDEHCV